MIDIFLVQPEQVSIFGFSGFITALALLVIIYTVTDIRYRFRIAIAPIPLFRITYFSIVFIGFGTLISDIWFAEHWSMPSWLSDQLIWQGVFGASFLLLVLIWIYFAYINPPKFCKNNYKIFFEELYRIIVKGSETELPIICDELRRSAYSIVEISKEYSRVNDSNVDEKSDTKKQKTSIQNYAYEILLLISNRKFCRHMVASSPITAIVFFEAMTFHQKYEIPIGQFARNISIEALMNKDSILYHEDEGYRSGLIGHVKPFSQSICGDYSLVESLARNGDSPLDIGYEMVQSWCAIQVKAYCRMVMITVQGYFKNDKGDQYPCALHRAFDNIKNSCGDVYKLNDIPDYYSTDISKRLSVVVDFITNLINFLDRQEIITGTILRKRNKDTQKDFYDYIVKLMFEVILSVASVKSPSDKCWSIHYCTVWEGFFGLMLNNSKACKIIHYKLRRLLYDEICRLKKSPNYKSSKILGFCLNVMGLVIYGKRGHNESYYPLHKATITWVKNNYLHLVDVHPEVARACLLGSISFDEQGERLVKTYLRGLSLEDPKEYLGLLRKEP